ncbi:hypothetical protein [Streptomyces sp. CAU 1734]|uniref:hypothetical protein n=1 Tax=Streptomyces sp. CAU 1734 TaxID=3140360 RepID=UPI003261B2F2
MCTWYPYEIEDGERSGIVLWAGCAEPRGPGDRVCAAADGRTIPVFPDTGSAGRWLESALGAPLEVLSEEDDHPLDLEEITEWLDGRGDEPGDGDLVDGWNFIDDLVRGLGRTAELPAGEAVDDTYLLLFDEGTEAFGGDDHDRMRRTLRTGTAMWREAAVPWTEPGGGAPVSRTAR